MFVVEVKRPFLYLPRKDPSAFFSFPVTDFIAPGYSMIIKHPMDFSTMREKIKNNDYQSIEELKVTRAMGVAMGRLGDSCSCDPKCRVCTHSGGKLLRPVYVRSWWKAFMSGI